MELLIASYYNRHQEDYPNSYLKMSFILADLLAALLSISVYQKYIIWAYFEIREFPVEFFS